MTIETLNKLWKKGTEFFGIEKAIIGGAMSWISDPDLAAAISNAGGVGFIAGGALKPEMLDEWIKSTQQKTKKTFGVNLMTMHPNLDDLIDVCGQNHVSHVILAGGVPKTESVKKIKDYGIKCMCFAPALVLAKRLMRAGVDAFVIEGHESGGHVGPITTTILAQEILPALAKDIPVFVAGGIGTGKIAAAYLMMGASGVQVGTRFVCTFECNAHRRFKDAYLKAAARDAMPTVQVDHRFPVIPVRAIANDATVKFMQFQHEIVQKYNNGEIELKDGQMKIESYWMGALRKAVVDGDVENGSVMAGQSVEFVKKEMSVKEVVDELTNDAAAELDLYKEKLS